MTRADRAKRVDSSRAEAYAEVGRRLLQAGRSLAAEPDSRHASAVAILAVHAAIAFVDAVTIHAGGRKSTSTDHGAVTRLLRDVLGNRLPAAEEKAIAALMSQKDQFEYQGYVARWSEATRLLQRAERVGSWAEQLLRAMPRRQD